MNKTCNPAFLPVGFGKQFNSKPALYSLVFLLTAFTAQAATVAVNFGVSSQNITLAGGGPNGSGLGQYTITLGSCSPNGGNTTCTLSGSFTGTTPGFTSGTYSLVTTYVGTGSSPLLGVQESAGSNFWNFSFVPTTATITLNLTTSTGTVIVPIIAGGQAANGVSLGFLYTLAETCSGTAVSSCSVGTVGLTAGAVTTGPTTGSASFIQSSQNYYFSHLTFSGGWQVTLTYINYSTQAVTCVTNFYTDSGSGLLVPFSGGTASTRTDTLLPGQSLHDQTVANLNVTALVGWAQATCTGPIQASLLYRLYQSGVGVGEAGVNAETAPTTKFATFAQTSTGVAYANPSTNQSATITLTVLNTAGAKIGSSIINIGPLGHGAANVGPLLGLQNFTGSILINSTVPIVSLSLNAEAFPVFSSMPAGDLLSTTTLVSP